MSLPRMWKVVALRPFREIGVLLRRRAGLFREARSPGGLPREVRRGRSKVYAVHRPVGRVVPRELHRVEERVVERDLEVRALCERTGERLHDRVTRPRERSARVERAETL